MAEETVETSFGKRWRVAIFAGIVIALAAVSLTFTPVRDLARRFLDSLRMQKVQAVNVDLSSFVGPNANHSVQQMVSQMISDKVVTTVNEQNQTADTPAAAAQLAGFPVKLFSGRKDAPKLEVGGAHAMNMTVDRARLQAIFNEAGRPDLVLPNSLDGAAFAVQLSRTVRAQYGNCPTRGGSSNGISDPPPASTEFSSCVVLSQGPSPVVNVPAGLDVGALAEIGLELAGMSPSQAQEFLHTVDWKTTLGMSLPRFMRSYEAVEINGVRGTLLNTAGRRGPTYTLVWAKDGMVYCITGFGNSGEAVTLAESLK
jgi:hypothetical protein